MRYIKGLFHSTPVWDSAFVIGDDLFPQILRSFSFFASWIVKYLTEVERCILTTLIKTTA